jgi:hypothetical protein
MISTVLWALGAVAIFLWNHYQTPYIGIRWTNPPINGAWLCVALTAYCLIRFFVRRSRGKHKAEPRA